MENEKREIERRKRGLNTIRDKSKRDRKQNKRKISSKS